MRVPPFPRTALFSTLVVAASLVVSIPTHAQPVFLAHFGAESGLGEWEGHALFLEEFDSFEGDRSFGLGKQAGGRENNWWSALSPYLEVPVAQRTGGYAVMIRAMSNPVNDQFLRCWITLYRFDEDRSPIDDGIFHTLPDDDGWALSVTEPVLLGPEVKFVRVEFNIGDPLLIMVPGRQHELHFDDVSLHLLKLFEVPIDGESVGSLKSGWIGE